MPPVLQQKEKITGSSPHSGKQKGRGGEILQRKKKWYFYPLSVIIGLLNGLFGAGGGVVAVPVLRGAGMREDEAHATSISITFPLAVMSGLLYLQKQSFQLGEAVPYLPGAALGSLAGAWLLPRISGVWLRRIFGAVVVFSALRLLLR